MIVVGIDPSLTSAGIAILRAGRPIMLTTVGHKHHGTKDWDQRVRRITAQTVEITTRIRSKAGIPDMVAIEAPLTFGIEGSADSYDRYCVFVGVCSQLIAWKCPYAVIHNQTRAKWATGYGSAAKRAAADPTGSTKRRDAKKEVLEAVRTTWAPWKHHIKDDNIADALILAEICARRLDEPLHFRVRLHQVEAMHTSITWPTAERTTPC